MNVFFRPVLKCKLAEVVSNFSSRNCQLLFQEYYCLGFASTIALLATAAPAASLASRCACLHHWHRWSGLGLHASPNQMPVGRQNPWARVCMVPPRHARQQPNPTEATLRWLLTTFPVFASTGALLATAAPALSLASKCSCLHHWLRGSGLGLHAP